jgi:hypothetical protein
LDDRLLRDELRRIDTLSKREAIDPKKHSERLAEELRKLEEEWEKKLGPALIPQFPRGIDPSAVLGTLERDLAHRQMSADVINPLGAFLDFALSPLTDRSNVRLRAEIYRRNFQYGGPLDLRANFGESFDPAANFLAGYAASRFLGLPEEATLRLFGEYSQRHDARSREIDSLTGEHVWSTPMGSPPYGDEPLDYIMGRAGHRLGETQKEKTKNRK